METKDMSAQYDEGLKIYEYIVNNCTSCFEEMPRLFEQLKEADSTGQFLASTARYLTAVDRAHYESWIPYLVEATIEKDRERKYIGALLEAVWGEGYQEKVEELRNTDDNFRRIYKRLYPSSVI